MDFEVGLIGTGFTGCIAMMLAYNLIKSRKVGEPEILTGSTMSKAEITSSYFKTTLALLADLLLVRYSYINSALYKGTVLGLMAVYAGYLVFPPIWQRLIGKDKMGLYVDGVITYSGTLRYKGMSEYKIEPNSHYEGNQQNMTAYFKSTVPFLGNSYHFDITEDQADEIGALLADKHREISGSSNIEHDARSRKARSKAAAKPRKKGKRRKR